MFLPSAKTLIRRLFNKSLVVSCVTAGLMTQSLLLPAAMAGDPPALSQEDYDEWGLTPPGTVSKPTTTPTIQTPSTNPQLDEYDDWGLTPPEKLFKPTKTTPAQETEESLPPSDEPAELVFTEEQLEQAVNDFLSPADQSQSEIPGPVISTVMLSTVKVIIITEDGKQYETTGYVVDRQKGIILTNTMVNSAKQLIVAYPNAQYIFEKEMSGGKARLLKYNTKLDMAFLQAEDMPEYMMNFGSTSNQLVVKPTPNTPPVISQKPTSQLPPIQLPPVSKPHVQTPPVSQTQNALVGKWHLDDYLNGYHIVITALFEDDGSYGFRLIMTDPNGGESEELEFGTYKVQGSTLVMQSQDGPQEFPYWFENGQLFMKFNNGEVTLCLQRM